MTKLINLHCDHLKSPIVTKLPKLKTQLVAILKNLNLDKTQKNKLLQNSKNLFVTTQKQKMAPISKPQIMTKLKNFKTTNSNYDKTDILD